MKHSAANFRFYKILQLRATLTAGYGDMRSFIFISVTRFSFTNHQSKNSSFITCAAGRFTFQNCHPSKSLIINNNTLILLNRKIGKSELTAFGLLYFVFVKRWNGLPLFILPRLRIYDLF